MNVYKVTLKSLRFYRVSLGRACYSLGMKDYQPWWIPLLNGASVITAEGFILISIWMFGELKLDRIEAHEFTWNDIGNKFCISEQFWAENEGLA